MDNIVYAAFDPGINGGICFIDNEKISVCFYPTLINKNDKRDYDIAGIASIIKNYKDRKVVCVIEAVTAMIGNGTVSSFNFGRGKGIIEGIAHSFGFKVTMVSPQTWKKHFNLIHHLDKEKTKLMSKKELSKLKAQIKKQAKTNARELAAKLCPELSGEFKKVNSDGKAEALLMAVYAKEVVKE